MSTESRINTLIKRVSKWTDRHYGGKKYNIWFNGKNTIIQDFSVIVFNVDHISPIVEVGEANEALINTAMNHFNMELDKELPMVGLRDLKNGLSALVGKDRTTLVTYGFGEDLPRVNARYLIHLMEGLQVYKITCGNSRIKPIKLYGKNGTAILLPVNDYDTDKGLKVHR